MTTYSVVGDSQAQGLIAAGFGSRGSWLAKLSRSGVNSEGLLALVREALALGVPDVFVVVAGGVDANLATLRRQSAWAVIVNVLRGAGVRRIVWVGPPASPSDLSLDARRRGVSEQQQRFFGANEVLWLDGRRLAAGLPYRDEVHLTRSGYQTYTARLEAALAPLQQGQGQAGFGPVLTAGLVLGGLAYWLAKQSAGGFELGELGRAKQVEDARDELVTPAQVRDRIRKRGYEAPLDKLPEHIRPYAEFMVRSSKTKPSARDIVKAYVITRSSVQRQAARYGTLCRYFPGLREFLQAYSTEKVRPEDAMSFLLLSKDGKRFLDKVSQGSWDYEAAEAAFALSARTKCFGFSQDLLLDMREAARLARKSGDISAALRTLPPEQWVKYVQNNIPGISGAKAGFFAALLGRGDVPTFDARELKLWRKDRKSAVDVKPVDVMALRGKIARWPMKLEPVYEPFRQHLVHHALWDAYPDKGPPTKTTHAEVVKALELAGMKRRK